jgi:hypothetical protein
MVDFISKWSKVFAKIWLVGYIVFFAILYANSAQDNNIKSWNTPTFATINLLMPFSLQKSLDNHYKTGCVLKSDFLFERSIVGHHKYEYNGWVFDNPPKYLGCYSGSRGGAIGILVNYLIFFIGLNYIVPWIARMFSSAGKIYKSSAKEAKVNTEKNYLIAYKEVESGKLKSPELWAKAFAETEGDEVKQKALYVELRTKQLDEM